MDWWGDILGTAGVSSVAIAAVVATAHVAKAAMQMMINKDLERFKADLRREAIEHGVRFKRVDEKVADILSEIYSLLWQLDDSLVRYVNPAAGTEEHYDSFETSRRKFEAAFFPKKLYVPPKLFTKVNELYKEIVRTATDFTKARRGLHATAEEQQNVHFWSEAVERVNVRTAPLLEQIAVEFQKYLGVEDRSEVE